MRLSKIAVASSVVGGSLVAGVAFAAWTADGTGSGYAQAETAQAVTTQVATTTADLYPGSDGDLNLRIVNPNNYDVTVTAVSGNGTIASPDSVCNASHGVTFANQTGLTLVVGANSTASHVLDDVVSMSNASVTACSGETFTVPVALTAGSTPGAAS